jgi:teichuronic acid biosynthesis glycosyltransferase TuaG
MPKVSIITPLYNNAGYVGDAIRSVLGQTFPDWEMIIVDDGSEDHPEDGIYAAAGNDPRIRLIRLEKRTGAAGARNVALDQASGDFIAFLDSDDTWKPEKLQQQVRFMETKDIAFSFSSYETMTQEGIPTGKTVHAPEIMDYRHYLRNTIIGCLTVMIDKRKTGALRMPDIRSSQDMALWLQILKSGHKAYGIGEVLATYRLTSSSNSAGKIKAAKDVWHVYREFEGLSLISSLGNFLGYAWHAIKKRI